MYVGFVAAAVVVSVAAAVVVSVAAAVVVFVTVVLVDFSIVVAGVVAPWNYFHLGSERRLHDLGNQFLP